MSVDLEGINLAGLQKGLRPDETIKLVMKRHWIVFVYTGLYALFLLVSSILLLAYREAVFSILGDTFFYVFMIIYWCSFLLFIFINWVNNELDLFIITDKRIRGIEQLSFLNRTISECGLDEIEEVNAQTRGLLANLLNFGIITMHTASEKSDFSMEFAPDPLNNAGIILNVIQDNKAKMRGVE